MARKPRIFSTASLTAMRDTELTGQDWRVLLWVSLHDGMSLIKGKGPGCYASNKTLFAAADCDYSSGCRSLSKLVKRGHLVREQIGRSTRYKVTFPDPDSLQACNISNTRIDDEPASHIDAIACKENFETRINLPKTDRDYSLRSSKLNSIEIGKLDSVETAHLLRGDENSIQLNQSDSTHWKVENGAEALATSVESLTPHLSPHFNKLDEAAQLVRFEEAFTAIGRDADAINTRERKAWEDWLFALADDFAGEATGYHAQRLLEEVEPIDDENLT